MNPSLTSKILRWTRVVACLLAMSSAGVQALPDDKNQSLRISADKQEIDLKQGVVIYSGDVKLIQGTLEITAQKIHVRKDKDQEEESFTAEGSPAHYQQQPEAGKPIIHAEAGTIHYNVKTEQLVLDKNVSIEQNGSVTKAGHVDYDIKSQTAKFSGTGRVETVIPAKPEKKE
ncbi:lipopolysaccharide transport periplasmic protein LptA [Cellvibrio zantedeschiae]|uniref:lipopolysaccharide transport periplasmic protein LptA n=1 Tax=Cellvibrio zantedeschiae TaxID=1237077 RepID=UPI0016760900|nr:lipopolysaccharide transport periplasmic protein LptA [Cellvibrio zantedeschiae]